MVGVFTSRHPKTFSSEIILFSTSDQLESIYQVPRMLQLIITLLDKSNKERL
jgi:hypothetical protein